MNELELVQPQSVNLVKKADGFNQESTAGLQLLKKILDNKSKKVVINGKRHIEFGDWVALGNAYGIDVDTTDVEPVEVFEVKGFKCKAKVVRIDDGTIIGGATAYCLENERNWKGKDYFQIASMAQTRAGSKALANVLRFVVEVDKALSGTPAEEMENSNGGTSKKAVPHQKKRAAKKQKKEEAHDNVIEAKAKIKKETVGNEPAKKSLKELADENPAINKAVKVLQEDPTATITVGSVSDKLLDLCDLGKISVSEYKEAKELI